jgi:hypothetical protein
MEKFLTALAVLATIATPTFAQSFCTCDGTGNVTKFTDNPITFRNMASAPPANGRTGLHSFAMILSAAAPSGSNDPAIIGGGSRGYNQMLRNY